MKVFAQLTPTGGPPLVLQMEYAISLTRLIVGDSPQASSFTMFWTITSSSMVDILPFCGLESSLAGLPLIRWMRVVLGTL